MAGVVSRAGKVAAPSTVLVLGLLTVWAVRGALSGVPTPGGSSLAAARGALSQAVGDAPYISGAHQTPLSDEPPGACPPTAVACVDLRTQRSWLQHSGVITYGPVPFMPADADAGPGSTFTLIGIFYVTTKNAHQVSTEFDEPMPNAVFFAPGGIAFHEGSLGAPSHGCVHLTAPDSAYYFDHLHPGDEVAVFT